MNDAALDDTLIALAHPTRRAILDRLARGEQRMTAVAEPFDISLNSISKHVRILERAKLVRRRREGREHFLSCNPKPLDDAATWIASTRARWSAAFDRLARALEES
ncbi:MAG TPA: metalloregulator ArsR/SmtB family transcription factor [Kofleriaceae bacterium]|jgi:DNA-binding transcriptional ArsR family regulator